MFWQSARGKRSEVEWRVVGGVAVVVVVWSAKPRRTGSR